VHYHSLRHGRHSVAFTLDRYNHTIEHLHDDAAAKVDGIFKAGSSKPVASTRITA